MKIFLFTILFLSCFLYSSNPPSRTQNRNTSTLQTSMPARAVQGAAHIQAPIAGTQSTDRLVVNVPVALNVPVSMHMHNNSTQHTDQNFEPHNVAHASSESKAITITSHWQQLSTYMAPLNNELNKLTGAMHHITRRWRLYTAGALYSTLFFFLVKTNHQMNSRDSWAQWKNHMSLAELQLHPQSKLAQDLLHDIQNRYMNKANPTDGITPLTQFIICLEQEKNQIEKYLYTTSWLSTVWLTRLFPFNDKKIEQARNARERLNFIHHIFISWAANQNILKIS